MFGENAHFIKSIEIDDSVFQCELDCSKKYLLELKWSADNEARQWVVEEKSNVLDDTNSSRMSVASQSNDSEAIKTLQETVADLQSKINELTALIEEE